jgi:signal transduction histidine kinase
MSYKWDVLCEEGLQFFGKMSASMSHEIKNVLAVINENAGLLQDFVYMHDKGMPIDAKQLKGVSQMIIKQVRRADSIMKNMNKFAHSTDQLTRAENLNDILDIVTKLASRFASMREVSLEKIPPDEPINIKTNPFLLENLIWLCLDSAMDSVGQGKTVRVFTKKIDNSAQITFSQLDSMPEPTLEAFPDKRIEALLCALQAEITVDSKAGTINISLPI